MKKEYLRPNITLVSISTQYGTMNTGSIESGNGNPGEILSKENTSVWDFEEEENQ